VLCCVVLCCAVLCRVVLCCAVLCYVVLCCKNTTKDKCSNASLSTSMCSKPFFWDKPHFFYRKHTSNTVSLSRSHIWTLKKTDPNDQVDELLVSNLSHITIVSDLKSKCSGTTRQELQPERKEKCTVDQWEQTSLS
jgi:hypothetical protein